MQLEYHKGEVCPYAERTGRDPVVCQEGFCNRCQIWYDFSRIKGLEEVKVKLGQCSKLDDCPKIKMILAKNLLDFQYAKAIMAMCAKCDEGNGTGAKLSD